VLLLRQRLLTLQGRFADLQSLLPLLRKRKVHPPARLDELETELAVRRLEAVATVPAELARVWAGLARRLRENPAIVAVYARALLKAGSQAGAEEVLRKALSTQWHARLIALYGELDGNEVRGALTRAERRLEQHQEDPALLLALGRLCLSQQLWGKARAYLETLSRLAPSPLVWRLLADACDELGDTRLAQQYRQRGLEHATAAALGRTAALTAGRRAGLALGADLVAALDQTPDRRRQQQLHRKHVLARRHHQRIRPRHKRALQHLQQGAEIGF